MVAKKKKKQRKKPSRTRKSGPPNKRPKVKPRPKSKKKTAAPKGPKMIELKLEFGFACRLLKLASDADPLIHIGVFP